MSRDGLLVWLLLAVHFFVPNAAAFSEAYTHADNGNTLYSVYGFLKCTSDEIHAPSSTEDISDLVKRFAQEPSPVKMRATRRGYHSPAGFNCPGRRAPTKFAAGESSHVDAEPTTTSVTLLLHSLNRIVSVDEERHQLTVQSGMTIQGLVDAAEANGMTVPCTVVPVYGNLTLSGVVATSAHGSGLHPVSQLGNLITKVKWVNGKGDIVVSDAATERGAREIRGLVGGLGLLGIITEFTFELESPSVTIALTHNGLDDATLATEETKLLHEAPFAILFWRPDWGKYRKITFKSIKADEELPAWAPPLHPKARSSLTSAVPDGLAGFVKESLENWEADPLEESPNAGALNAGICGLATAFFSASFFEDEDGTKLDNVTLPTNRAMLSPECAPQCVHQTAHMGAALKDVEFSLKLSHLEEFVKDMKAIVKAELDEIQGRLDFTWCMPPGYFWFRFGGKSKSLLATSTGDEDVVYIQYVILEAAASSPEKHQKGDAIMQTFEQLMLCKYKARPHWGKNHERVFRHPKCHVRDNYPDGSFVEMLKMQKEHDPKKMFEPQLFKHVLERNGPQYYERCNSASWCYCEANEHCPEGNVCRPSPVFPEYKICRLDTSSIDFHNEL